MKKNSLVRRFGILFILFALVTIAVSGLVAYSFQTRQYHETSKEHLKQMTSYLTDTILMDGDEMILLKKWFSEHPDQVEVPQNFREDMPRANAPLPWITVRPNGSARSCSSVGSGIR